MVKDENNKHTMEELKKEILQFCDDRGWRQLYDPKNLAVSLSLEAAEVLELFQWTKDNEINKDKLDELQDELADVLIYLIQISECYDIDLIKAAFEKIEKNRAKYTIEKSKGVCKKYTDL